MKRQRLCIVFPAYNEAPVIDAVLKKVQATTKAIFGVSTDLVVVNDGSSDKTAVHVLSHPVTLLNHKLNRGLGGALATGLEYAKLQNYDLALTMDSDGQHDPQDIKHAILPILKDRADVVIGSRLKKFRAQNQLITSMPLDRIVINWVSSFITWLLFGVWTTDSQSGFRVFNKKALNLIQLKTRGMEVSSEFFAEVKKNQLRLIEVPIRVIYTDYSRTKGQTNLNSLNIGYKLLLRLFR